MKYIDMNENYDKYGVLTIKTQICSIDHEGKAKQKIVVASRIHAVNLEEAQNLTNNHSKFVGSDYYDYSWEIAPTTLRPQ